MMVKVTGGLNDTGQISQLKTRDELNRRLIDEVEEEDAVTANWNRKEH